MCPDSYVAGSEALNANFGIMGFAWTLLQVSRPGFFHVTAIPYALPSFRDPSVLLSPRGILGLLVVLLPLNLLVYSFNDFRDVDIDAKNPRKGGLHGAQASESDLRKCMALSVASLAFFMPVLTADFWFSFKWVSCCILVNWLYNFGPQLSRVPLLDMFPPLGYLCTSLFSAKVMNVPDLDSYVYLYFSLMCFRTQLWLQRMDIEADSAAGKHTSAVFLGRKLAAAAVIFFLASEFYVCHLRGCTPGIFWCLYSSLVLGLELVINKKEATMMLMAVVGIPFSIFFMLSDSCLVAA